jgi:hypothetical protein
MKSAGFPLSFIFLLLNRFFFLFWLIQELNFLSFGVVVYSNVIHFLSMMREAEGGKMKGRRRGVSLDAHKHKEEVRSFLDSCQNLLLLRGSTGDITS